MTKAIPVTNDANCVFTLFPKLPLELRLKIWKHTLPGPRVVPICTWGERPLGGHRVKRFASLNSSINITSACHEARAVVMETYDQFPNVIWQLSGADRTAREPGAVVYIDYSIDTVYADDRTGANRIITPYLGKVQHLAFALTHNRTFRDWAMLKRDCSMLKDLTFIETRTGFGHKHDEEWRLVDVPADSGPAVTPPQLDEHRHYIGEQFAKVLDDHGNLALVGAEAKETLEYFEKQVRDLEEWKDVSLKIAIVAQRKINSVSWMLIYPVWGLTSYMYKYVHWHEEPVLLGDGAVTSCRPDPHPNRRCQHCSSQRGFLSNDAFCLFKSEGEEDNRSGGPQDSFAGSAEDVVDEEPENDIEGVSYTASGDSYDSMEASTGDPNVEFAEGY